MKKIWYALPLLVLLSGLAGCALTGISGPKAEITVANSFKSIQAGSPPVTLTASGPNGQPIVVNWALTYANQGCTPACGNLAPSGASAVYTPPATAPAYGAATISVQSGSNTWVDDIQITPGISVSITNKFSTEYSGGPQVVLTAAVSNDSANGGVTWTLQAGGSNCSPACGTLTAGTGTPVLTATYVPPATVPAGANASPTITATSVTKTSASDSFSFTITSASSVLSGNYAVLVRGYYLPNAPMAIAGSVTADGNGNITGGEFDIDNDGGVTHIAAPVTGTYSVDLSFNGAARGRISITSFKFPGSNNGVAFDFVLSSDHTRGRVVELDGSAFINTGTFLQQSPTALSAANPAGTYAFGLDSDAPVGGRIVEAGQFVLSGGQVTGGLIDRSQAGAPAPIYSDVTLTPSAATNPDASGRGTLTLTAQGESTLYAYYVVSSNQLNLVEIDSGANSGVQAGVARTQSMPFTASSVNTTSVVQLTGMDTVAGTANSIGPDVIIGVLNISGGNAFTLTYDENDLGKVLTKHTASGTVSFDPTTGRGTFSDPGGFENAFMDSTVFYLYDTGKAFVVDADISTCSITTSPCSPAVPPSGPITNVAFSGTFTSQASGPFSESSLNGNLIAGSGASAIPDVPDMAAIVAADGSSGQLSIEADLDTSNPQTGNLQNYAFAGTYSIASATSGQVAGYGTATLPAFVFDAFVPGNASASMYLIAPNQAVLIGTQSGTYSGVSFLDPP